MTTQLPSLVAAAALTLALSAVAVQLHEQNVRLDGLEARTKTEALVAADAKAPTPERLTTRADVQRKVDAMIASGRARRDDVLALRREIADDGAERSEVARQIAVAINTGKLTPEDPRTPVP